MSIAAAEPTSLVAFTLPGTPYSVRMARFYVRAIAIVVTDPCPLPPVMNDPAEDTEHGRGLLLVDALSVRWGWKPQDPGKAVYAILAKKGLRRAQRLVAAYLSEQG